MDGRKIMLDFHDLPSVRGTYLVHLCIAGSQALTIGHLGQYHLPSGCYFYIGSAHGTGGLQARIGRHLRGDGKPHWHIDYLRAVADVRGVFYTVTDEVLECTWSLALRQLPQAFIPIPHFGASDCRSGCAAHLVALPRCADIDRVPQVLAPITPTPIGSLRHR
jgi:Uri superfamily endonuclease